MGLTVNMEAVPRTLALAMTFGPLPRFPHDGQKAGTWRVQASYKPASHQLTSFGSNFLGSCLCLGLEAISFCLNISLIESSLKVKGAST